MQNVTVVDHPLITHKLTHLRKIETPSREFRELVKELSSLMAWPARLQLQVNVERVQFRVRIQRGNLPVDLASASPPPQRPRRSPARPLRSCVSNDP